MTELSHHHANGGAAQERTGVGVEAFPILGQATASVQPTDGSLDDPAFRHDDKFAKLGAFDDLDIDVPAHALQSVLEKRSLIAAVGIELEQEWKHAEQRAHQQQAAIAILDVGGVNDGVQQQALRIYQDVTLLSLDLLAGVVTRRIDMGPPFSALFTLWLSMMAAVGLACRSSISRHWI